MNRYFIDHSKHRTKDKAECFQCNQELENLKADYLDAQIDQVREFQFHRHDR